MKFYDIVYKIDALLSIPSLKNLEEIEQYFLHDGVENYFFQQLFKVPNPFQWLKPLKEKGYFNPEKNPKTEVLDNRKFYRTPKWNVLDYLENVAQKNAENPDDEITNILIEIVNQIINYRDEEGERIENYITDKTMIKIIFSLPIEKITEQHIDFIKVVLNSKWNTTLIASEIGKVVFPKLIEDKASKHLLKLLDIILSYKKVKKQSFIKTGEQYEYVSVIDEYWLNKALTNYKPQIAELCGVRAVEIAINKMRNIIREDKNKFDIVWIPTIENHPQTSFTDRYECQLVYYIRDIFEYLKPADIRKYIEVFLEEDHAIFKRIAVHLINYYYEKLKDLFWNYGDNFLENIYLKHEVYELLKNNCKSFSEEQIDKVIEWIESKKYYISESIKDDEKQTNKIIAYRKKEWLSALLDTNNSKVLEYYKKYNQINPEELYHPGFNSWVETNWGYESSISENEFLKMKNEDIAEYFSNPINSEDPLDVEDIAGIFKRAVVQNPEKFINDIELFFNIPHVYQDSLLSGINESWRSGKKIDWAIVFNFIMKLISLDDFWHEKNEKVNYKNWVISTIAEIIEDGTKGDKNAFEPEYLDIIEQILLIIAQKTESDLYEMNNLATAVLNSTQGKIFSAMVNYSLRYARLYNKDMDEKWISSIREYFTQRLDNKDYSVEFYFTLGKYLASFYWLDKKWVIDNINKIFYKDDNKLWKDAFTGYLFYSAKVYKEIYMLLKENEHYSMAIKIDFNDLHINERLAQHICVGYIAEWEKLENEGNLISELIRNGNIDKLNGIITYFWMLRDKLDDKIRVKIKPLWKELYESIKENEEKTEYQQLSSSLSKWLSLIDEIDDEIFELMKFSAKHINMYSDASFVLEYLLKHVSKTPSKVGEIYLEMLNAGIYETYESETVKGIVRVLYEQEEKEIADRICNLYGAKGFTFLRPLYEKYNSTGNTDV